MNNPQSNLSSCLSSVGQAVKQIAKCLVTVSDTARLDAEILVMTALNCERSYLFSDPEFLLSEEQRVVLQSYVKRRLSAEPIALIVGFQEFWSLRFKLNKATLIPRPETEHLVEWVLQNFSTDQKIRLADLGTGSGAIAIALARERPGWVIDASDLSALALLMAKENASQNHVTTVNFYQGSWCQALPMKKYDIIVSNPPYIAEDDPHILNLTFEPQLALTSGEDGLAAIKTIILQATKYLFDKGYLVIEHGFDQQAAVQSLMADAGFSDVVGHQDLAGQPRYVIGRW